MPKLFALALIVCFTAWSTVSAENRQMEVYYDIAAGPDGRLTGARPVGDVPQALRPALMTWLKRLQLDAEDVKGVQEELQSSIRIKFQLRPNDDDESSELIVDEHRVGPRPTHIVQPSFPWSERDSSARISVKVSLLIDERGHPQQIEMLDEVKDDYREAVRKALKEWRFKPESVDGKVQPTMATQTFTFMPRS